VGAEEKDIPVGKGNRPPPIPDFENRLLHGYRLRL
jgi:hypothetical protein